MSKAKRMLAFLLVLFMTCTMIPTNMSTVEAATVNAKSITLNKSVYTMKKGKKVTLKATVAPANATQKKVVWSTSNKKVATVSSTGVVKAKKKGKVTITAKIQGTNIKKTCKITVGTPVSKVKLNKKKISLKPKKSYTLKATLSPKKPSKKGVTWKSSNTNVATVSSKGKVKAKLAGTTTITATAKDGTGKKATCKVTVGTPVTGIKLNATKATVAIAKTYQLKATVSPSKATTKTVTWKSSNANIATVSSKGLVTAKAPGTAVITAYANDASGKKVACTVTVPAIKVTGITLNQTSVDMMLNSTPVQLAAKVTPANATNKAVTWSVADSNVATVSNTGVVTPVAAGETKVVATAKDSGLKAECTVRVSNGARVTTATALEELLKSDKSYELIEYVSDAEEIFDINVIEGKDFTNTVLKIDAPNASITNHIDFKEVIIVRIKSETYKEYADNNVNVQAPDSRIIIGEGAKVVLTFAEGVKSTALVNNGQIDQLTLKTSGSVEISGQSSQAQIPTVVDGAATIYTAKALDIVANEKAVLLLKAGAEGTNVSTEKEENVPEVSGLGTVTVVVGNDEVVIIAKPTEEETGAEEDIKKFTGAVQDVAGTAIEGAKVYLIPYDADFTIDDFKNDAQWMTETDEEGFYSLEDIEVGNYYLIIRKDNYMDAVQTCVFTTADAAGEAVNNKEITMVEVPSEDDKPGSVSGVILDGVTGDPVEGLTIRVRTGNNNISGETCADDVTTDEGGYYRVEGLKAGAYTIQVVDLRNADGKYVIASFNVIVQSGKDTTDMGTAVSPVIDNEQIRFVLTWGNEASGAPADLDSHIVGPTANGKKQFHVYFGEDNYYSNDKKMVDLDVDDVEWEGPETITIYEKASGVYYYCIHDYTNRESDSSVALATSGAKVEVYRGANILQSFYVPNQEGTVWNVCSYSTITNKITPINQMEYESEAEVVGGNLYYGDLKITSIETNEFVLGATIDGSWIDLELAGEVTEDTIGKIVPVIAQEDASYEFKVSEYGKYYILIKGTDGLTREYYTNITYDYKDLYIKGFKTNDIVTDYEIGDSEEDMYIRLYMTDVINVEDNLNKIVPIIAQEDASAKVFFDDDEYEWVIVITGENDIPRRYYLYICMDYGDLEITEVTTDHAAVKECRVDESAIYLLLEDSVLTEEILNSLVYRYAKEGVETALRQYDDGYWYLEITDGNQVRTYDFYYDVTYAEGFSIQEVKSDDSRITQIDVNDSYFEIYIRGTVEDLYEAVELLEFEFGDQVDDNGIEIDEDDSDYGIIWIENEVGARRTYNLYYYRDYGELRITSVSEELDYISIGDWDDDYIDLYVYDRQFTAEIGEALDIAYGVDNVTESFEYDEDNERWYLVITDGTNTRKCRIYVYQEYSSGFDFDEVDWTSADGNSDNPISYFSWNDEEVVIYGYYGTNPEAELGNISFKCGELVESWEIQEDTMTLVLKGDNGAYREYEIYFAIDYEGWGITEVTGDVLDDYYLGETKGQSYINLYLKDDVENSLEVRESVEFTFSTETTSGEFNEDATQYTITDSETGWTRTYELRVFEWDDWSAR